MLITEIERRTSRPWSRAVCRLGAAAVLAAVACIAAGGWLRNSDAEAARRMRARAIRAELLPDAGAVRQKGHSDCGPAALLRALALLGHHTNLDAVSEAVDLRVWGSSAAALVAAARAFGVEAEAASVPVAQLPTDGPTIVLIDRHWIVIEKRMATGRLEIFDPSLGRLDVPIEVVASGWRGVAILLARPRRHASLEQADVLQ
jgi:hypothetical protein